MSSITLPASLSNAKMDTYTRLDGADTVHVQAIMVANAASETTGSITSNGQSITAIGLADMDGVLVTTSGTFSGTLAFEASRDGTSWYTVLMTRASATTQESSRALTGTTLEAWRANISGWAQFRVRCSAYTSGTAAIAIEPVNLAFEPSAAPVSSVTASLAAGTALAGDVGIGARTTTTNTVLQSKVLSAASTNAANIKAAAGRIYGWSLSNTTAAWKFVKLYNLATAPTVGTSVPTFTIGIPPNGTIERSDNIGVFNSTGIAIAVTGGSADTDATAVAAGDVVGSVFYA